MSDNLKYLTLARRKLHPAELESGLIGREGQFQELKNFLFERLKFRNEAFAKKKARIDAGLVANIKGTHMNKTIFICGVPGTGKTACVNLVISELQKISKENNSPIKPFQYIYINAQHLSSPERIYSEMLRLMNGTKQSPANAIKRLQNIFLGNANEQYKVIVIDELDLLYDEKKKSLLYNLFDWPTTSESKMILIAIANAMDLSERCRGRIKSRMGWDNLVFESYSNKCLENIILNRLGKELLEKTFDRGAIVVATKKVGRTTGDARRILDTCCLAIDKTIELGLPKVISNIIDQVGFTNVDSQRNNLLKMCRPMNLLVLKSILRETDSVGEENVTVFEVERQFSRLVSQTSRLKEIKFNPSGHELNKILDYLAASSLIYMEDNKPFYSRKVCIKDSSNQFRESIRSASLEIF